MTLLIFHFLTGYMESFGFENTFKSLSPTIDYKPIGIDLFGATGNIPALGHFVPSVQLLFKTELVLAMF